MSTPRIRTYADLSASLQGRGANTKAAATKAATDGDPTPEKDPQDKGHVAIPKDPDAVPAKQNTPESKTNADTTQSFTVSPSKKIEGEEKPASSLAAQATKVAQNVRNLAASLTKKSTGAGTSLPVMPPNDKKNEGTAGGALKPPSGGAGPKNNPDPAVVDTKKAAATAVGGNTKSAEQSKGTEMEAKAEPGKKVSMPAGDSKGDLPKDKTNTNETTVGHAGKSASDDNEIPLDPSFHMKLAHIILSTEEGRTFAQAAIEKYHGAQAAADIVKAASIMEARAQELSALEESGAREAEEAWNNATPEERQKIASLINTHVTARESYGDDLLKQAYSDGAGAAATMADQGALGQEEPQDLEQAIMQAISEMVQSGEITEQQAMEILQAIQSGDAQGAGGASGPGAEGAAGPEAGGAGGPMAGAGGPPPEAAGGGAGGPPPEAAGGPPKVAEKSEGKGEEKKEDSKEASTDPVLAAARKVVAAQAKA